RRAATTKVACMRLGDRGAGCGDRRNLRPAEPFEVSLVLERGFVLCGELSRNCAGAAILAPSIPRRRAESSRHVPRGALIVVNPAGLRVQISFQKNRSCGSQGVRSWELVASTKPSRRWYKPLCNKPPGARRTSRGKSASHRV